MRVAAKPQASGESLASRAGRLRHPQQVRQDTLATTSSNLSIVLANSQLVACPLACEIGQASGEACRPSLPPLSWSRAEPQTACEATI